MRHASAGLGIYIIVATGAGQLTRRANGGGLTPYALADIKNGIVGHIGFASATNGHRMPPPVRHRDCELAETLPFLRCTRRPAAGWAIIL